MIERLGSERQCIRRLTERHNKDLHNLHLACISNAAIGGRESSPFFRPSGQTKYSAVLFPSRVGICRGSGYRVYFWMYAMEQRDVADTV